MKTVVDFFAGSGLVSAGLSRHFSTIWANDIDEAKAIVYNNNIKENRIVLEDICKIKGDSVPRADLYWASFPCQDLSLAGNYSGLSGDRSSLVKEFFRIIEEKDYSDRPNIIALENVYGLITSNHGHDLLYIHSRLISLGYNSGAVVIDASYWVPQSRVRIFIVATKKELEIEHLITSFPTWCHPKALSNIAQSLDNFIYWNLPKPNIQRLLLKNIIERDADIDTKKSKHFLSLIPESHLECIKHAFSINKDIVFSGYKRTRTGKQTLEVRLDEIGGCLRTAGGGSSKQLLIFYQNDSIFVRYMTAREAARLMGAPDNYWLPENKNQAYTAMGDAVALPVTEFLSETILNRIEEKVSIQYAYA